MVLIATAMLTPALGNFLWSCCQYRDSILAVECGVKNGAKISICVTNPCLPLLPTPFTPTTPVVVWFVVKICWVKSSADVRYWAHFSVSHEFNQNFQNRLRIW